MENACASSGNCVAGQLTLDNEGNLKYSSPTVPGTFLRQFCHHNFTWISKQLETEDLTDRH